MREAIRIPAEEVSPTLRALFDAGQPVAIRCFAVLDGAIRGQIWTNDLVRPTWGAVQEGGFGTLFLGGRPEASLVHELVEELRPELGVAFALWPDHPYNQLLPSTPDFDGWELEFTDRPPGQGLDAYLSVPEGCELRPIDARWLERCRYGEYYTAYFGSVERTLEQGFGFCLLRKQELVSEAFAAFLVPEGDDYRLRWFTPTVEVPLCGHATLASAAVVMERLQPARSLVIFSSASGSLRVTKTGAGYVMNFPVRLSEQVSAPPGLAEALGVDPIRKGLLCS